MPDLPLPPPHHSGRIIQFSCQMKSRGRFEVEDMHRFGPLAIRIQPISKDDVAMLHLPEGTTWVWAVVQVRPGLPDALLFGGTADSWTSAAQQARDEYDKREAQRQRTRDDRKKVGT